MCAPSSMRTICTATRRSPRAQSGSSKGEQILPTERPTALCCYVGRLERAERNQLAAGWWTKLLTTVHESVMGHEAEVIRCLLSLSGAKQTTLEKQAGAWPGDDPLRPVPGVPP